MADIFLNILEIAGISAIITVILLVFEKIILK